MRRHIQILSQYNFRTNISHVLGQVQEPTMVGEQDSQGTAEEDDDTAVGLPNADGGIVIKGQ